MIRVSSDIHQRAINAQNNAGRVASAMNGCATFAALCAAEGARNRAMDDLRAMGPIIRALRAEAKRFEKARAVDASIVARDAFNIPAAG